MDNFEKNNSQQFLIKLCDADNGSDYYVRICDICGIKKIFAHPNNSDDKNGFPKYQVFLKNSQWSWVLISIEDFEKYIKSFVINLN